MLYHGTAYENIWQANHLNKQEVAYKPVLIEGVISAIPKYGERTQISFIIDVLGGKGLEQPISAKLSWKNSLQVIKHNQRWSLLVKLKPATGLANPYTFSYQTWLRANGIHATGYVKSSVLNQLLATRSSWQQRFYDKFESLLPEGEMRAIILALSMGIKADISPNQWQVFRQTSTQHLIAISGLHIGLVLFFTASAFALLAKVFTLPPLVQSQKNAWVNRVNSTQYYLLLGIVCAFCYAYLSGFSIPTQRALIMVFFLFVFKTLNLNFSLFQYLLTAVLSITVLMPTSLFSVSFWLSFYAVTLIGIFIWRFKQTIDTVERPSYVLNMKQRTVELIKLQLFLTVFMFPFSVLLNQKLYLAGILANLVAIPVISFFVMPLIVVAMGLTFITPFLASLLLSATQWLLNLLWDYLFFLSGINALTIDVNVSHLVICLLCLLLVWLAIKYVKRVKPVILCLFFVASSVYANYLRKEESWRMHVLDVGQGLAVLIENGDSVMLYDTGPSFQSGFNTGDAVVLPVLRGFNKATIDVLVLSHLDNDHAGSIQQIARQAPIKRFLGNGHYFLSKNACVAGGKYHLGQLLIEVLWPEKSEQGNIGKANDDSCVLKVSDEHHSVLLPGDISSKIEKKLVAKYRDTKRLNSQVLIAPHHGSKTSSTIAFIQAIDPEYVVFSTAKYNRWKMPNIQVQDRYEKLDVKTFNTADSGMVTLEFSSNDINIKQYRQDTWPFWFAN